MNNPKKSISSTEWRLMKIIWRKGPCAARDVYQVAEERYGISVGTTKNLLFRLVEKGYLKTKQIGNSYLYTPLLPMLDSICDATDDLLENTTEEVVDTLMLNLVRQGKLSEKGIKKLRVLLDEYEE